MWRSCAEIEASDAATASPKFNSLNCLEVFDRGSKLVELDNSSVNGSMQGLQHSNPQGEKHQRGYDWNARRV